MFFSGFSKTSNQRNRAGLSGPNLSRHLPPPSCDIGAPPSLSPRSRSDPRCPPWPPWPPWLPWPLWGRASLCTKSRGSHVHQARNRILRDGSCHDDYMSSLPKTHKLPGEKQRRLLPFRNLEFSEIQKLFLFKNVHQTTRSSSKSQSKLPCHRGDHGSCQVSDFMVSSILPL